MRIIVLDTPDGDLQPLIEAFGSASRAIQAGANDFLVRTGDLTNRVTPLLLKIRGTINCLLTNLWKNQL